MARDLPKRMHFKHGRYYYVHKNKWTPLSTNFHEALAQYGKLIAPMKGGMAELISEFMASIVGEVAPSTLRNYTVAAERLRSIFIEFAPEDVKPRHVAEMMEHFKATPAMANTMRNVLKQVFVRAVTAGKCDTNPVVFVGPRKQKKRERYITDAEFAAIKAQATPTLAAIMDICYLTGQRIGDVLSIRLADIDEGGIFFRQKKTGNRLRVTMTPDLARAIAAARSLHTSVHGLTLFHTRGGKPFAYWTVRTLWERATLAAGIADVHIHDMRAKAATDAKAQGLDSKTLLGHASESSHLRYLRSKETPEAQPPKLRQSKT
jgi:integrase